MAQYPEKTCSIDRLVTQPRLVAMVLAGTKTQQRRNGVYAYPGETFELEGKTFVLTGLTHDRIGDMTDEDAQKEGFPNLATYIDIILKMHSAMTWDPDGRVWTHTFAAQASA